VKECGLWRAWRKKKCKGAAMGDRTKKGKSAFEVCGLKMEATRSKLLCMAAG